MTILDRLIKSIDEFYTKASQSYKLIKLAAPPGYSMPDNNEEDIVNPAHYDELIDISYRVGDPGLAQQLQTLAELYKRSIIIGGGYNTIVRAINNLRQMYSDDKDSDIDFILNQIIVELSKRAGGTAALSKPDDLRFMQELQRSKQDFESKNREQQAEAEAAYQEDMNVPGAIGETEGDLTEGGLGAEEGESVFDPTGGMGGGKDGPKVNVGWHATGRAGLPKDWVTYYADEAKAYEVSLAEEQDPKIAKTLKSLIILLRQISAQIKATLKLNDDIKIAPDPEKEALLSNLYDKISKLKNEKNNLKISIRSNQIKKSQSKLELELKQERDPKIKELYKQKMALNELSLSSDWGKTKERNARLRLIRMMEGGNYPSQKDFDRAVVDIEKAKTDRIPAKEYRKKYIENIKNQFVVAPGTKGRRAISTDMDALIFQFKSSLFNIKMGIKKNITKKLENEENTKYKPYKDAIAIAHSSNDKVAEKTAIKALSVVLNADAELDPQIIEIVEYSRIFTNYLKDLTALQKSESKNEFSSININDLIFRTDQLIIIEGGRGKNRNVVSNLAKSLKAIKEQLEARLTQRIRVSPKEEKKVRVETISPETGEVSYEDMNEDDAMALEPSPMRKILKGFMNKKQRKIALARLNKTALLDTSHDAKASEIMNDPSLNNIQDPNEYSHNVFEKLLNNLHIKNIDD